jgi:hypothetical protein
MRFKRHRFACGRMAAQLSNAETLKAQTRNMKTRKTNMKSYIGLIVIAGILAHTGTISMACSNREAWGASVDEQTIEDVKIVNITCSACYQCLGLEGRPADCGTDCIPVSTVSPTHIIYQWNPGTGQWEIIGTPSGSCQMHMTVNCL